MFDVVAAVIYFEGKILCFQRGSSKYPYTSLKYEFPGGKLEYGESPEEALRREILEELDLVIVVRNKLLTLVHHYPDFSIQMHCFECTTNDFEGYLSEHVSYAALEPHQLDQLDWIDADKTIVKLLKERRDDAVIQ